MNENIVVLGLGNILCGDDGFGVRAAQKLYEDYDFPANITLVDGGTQGPTLFRFIEEADRLLIFDAVDFGLSPGILTKRDNAEIPIWLGMKKISAHQNSFAELLALADLKNAMPDSCILIGLQPESAEFGTAMSALAFSRLAGAIDLGLECLAAWGIRPTPARAPKSLVPPELLQSRYFSTPRR